MSIAVTPALELDPAAGPPLDPIRIETCAQRILGRVDQCDIVLRHNSVSRRHALIEHRESGWFVMDPGSQNGTYVNSMRLETNEPATLRDLDLLRITPWTFIVRIPGDGEPPPPEPPPSPPEPDPPAANEEPSGTGTYATRASIFLRLGDPDTEQRELSWREFHQRYGPVILGFARNAGLPSQEAEDTLQDVLMGFFRVSSAFEYDPAKGRFRGYLKTMTLNAIRGQHRRRRPEVYPDVEPMASVPATVGVIWNHEWAKRVLELAMEEASTRFEPATYEAFELYGRRGVPVEAAAERLGMTVDAVRQAKCRVVKAVRETIERIRANEG